MIYAQSIFLLSIVLVTVTACNSNESFEQQLARVLKEDPSILSKSIENNPTEYVLALQSILMKVRQEEREKLKANQQNEIKYYLSNPLKPRLTENDLYEGDETATLTIVQYINYNCQFCAQGNLTMQRLRQRYGQRVRLLIRHGPMKDNQRAYLGAKYLEALKRQDHEMALNWHHRVMRNLKARVLDEDYYQRQAVQVGANLKKLNSDLNDPSLLRSINQDQLEASAFGFNATPGYVVGGVPIRGAYPEETFIRVIEQWKMHERLGVR